MRTIFVEASRLERAQEAVIPAANAGDDKAINCLAKLSERRSALLGLNAPLRIDPIQSAETAGLTSTEQLRSLLDDLRSEDKQSIFDCGPGYGDWRDDRDREELAKASGPTRVFCRFASASTPSTMTEAKSARA